MNSRTRPNVNLGEFAREAIKAAEAGKSGLASRAAKGAWRWFTTSPTKVGKDLPGAAKKVVEHAGKKLKKDELWNLRYIAAGKPWKSTGEAKKYVQGKLREHGVRHSSLKKPLIAAGVGVGTVAGVSSGRKKSTPGLHMIDRSPQLVQDPSRVVY